MVITFFVSSFTLSAQKDMSHEQRRVNETVTKLFDGIAELDFSKIKRNTTEDVIVLESGAIWNMDSLTNRLEPLRKMNFKRTNDLNFIKTEVKGNTAWVIYNNTAKMSIDGKPRNANWLESAVLIKASKDWKIKLLHSTTVQPKEH